MKLPSSDAKQCISLLDQLDIFTLTVSNSFKKKKPKFIKNINTVRLKARNLWTKDAALIENFISSNKNLTKEEINIVRG